MLRQALLRLARAPRIRDRLDGAPVTAAMADRYLAGTGVVAAVDAGRSLVAEGLLTCFDPLMDTAGDPERAEAATADYLELLDLLGVAGLARHAEVVLRLGAIGQALPGRGDRLVLDHARRICHAARNVGATVTVDGPAPGDSVLDDPGAGRAFGGDSARGVDRTLGIVHELRKDFPETGAVLRAGLRRTEADCRALAYEGSRVRLRRVTAAQAGTDRHQVDRAYVRCLAALMAGGGHPMVAGEDSRIVRIAIALATRHDRGAGSYEFAVDYHARPEVRARLLASGESVRVRVPYGPAWRGYLAGRLADRPADLRFFVRQLVSRS